MMKNKKPYFFGLKWRNSSFSKRMAVVWAFILLFIISRFLPIDDSLGASIAGTLWIGFYCYLFYEWSRKNAVYFRYNPKITIKIAGEKLEFDATFISDVWIDEDGLNIQRVNRVDTFPVDHLREEDVERLFSILKEYVPEQAV